MPDLTIAIACGPGHENVVKRAIDSCVAQTSHMLYGVLEDKAGKGTGWARNQLLQRVTTPYVAFLDADDYLSPEFAQTMLGAAYENPTRYIYCGWIADEMGQEFSPPDRCYCFDNGCLVHPVTTLLRTDWAREIGGFDETLPGMEDTDFYLKLTGAGHCGYRLDMPLFHWSSATPDSRSFKFRQRADYQDIKLRIGQKYNKGAAMVCCGGPAKKNEGPFGEKQAGDVLAHMLGTPLLGGYVGRHTRRIYPGNAGYGDLVWAHPGDVHMDPQKFMLAQPPQAPQVIVSAPSQHTVSATPDQPVVTSAAELADVLQSTVRDGNDVYLPQNEAKPVDATKIRPSALRGLARF